MGKSEITCDCEIIHQEKVDTVRKEQSPAEIIEKLSGFYKIFSDSTRLKILSALDKCELCVCDLSALLDMTISAVSHQLKVLREANLVKTQREGKVIYYFLADEHVKKVLECGLEHIQEEE